MARRRYISTLISVDEAMQQLSDSEALLWTWMIPHAEDDATITANVTELAAMVVPNRRTWTRDKVASSVSHMEAVDLFLTYEGRLYFPPDSFYRFQSNVPVEKRRTWHPEKNPCKEVLQKKMLIRANISASPSPSPSPSPLTKATISAPVTEEEQKVLDILATIQGFPQVKQTDLDLLREPRDPRVSLLTEAKGYRDWVADQRDKGKTAFNFRSSWRNRLSIAERICKERNGPLPASHAPLVMPEDTRTPEEKKRDDEEGVRLLQEALGTFGRAID